MSWPDGRAATLKNIYQEGPWTNNFLLEVPGSRGHLGARGQQRPGKASLLPEALHPTGTLGRGSQEMLYPTGHTVQGLLEMLLGSHAAPRFSLLTTRKSQRGSRMDTHEPCTGTPAGPAMAPALGRLEPDSMDQACKKQGIGLEVPGDPR